MATATQSTVILNREQRSALCDLAWTYLFEGAHPSDANLIEATIGCGQMFDTLQYAEENPAAETFELPLTPEITGTVREALSPFADTERELIEEYRDETPPSKSTLRYRAVVAALDAILEVA